MIPVRNDQTFLDLTVQQIEALNKQVRTEKNNYFGSYTSHSLVNYFYKKFFLFYSTTLTSRWCWWTLSTPTRRPTRSSRSKSEAKVLPKKGFKLCLFLFIFSKVLWVPGSHPYVQPVSLPAHPQGVPPPHRKGLQDGVKHRGMVSKRISYIYCNKKYNKIET